MPIPQLEGIQGIPTQNSSLIPSLRNEIIPSSQAPEILPQRKSQVVQNAIQEVPQSSILPSQLVDKRLPIPLTNSLERPVFDAPNPTLKYPVFDIPTQPQVDSAIKSDQKKKEEEEKEKEKERKLSDSPPPVILPQLRQLLPQKNQDQDTQQDTRKNTELSVNTNLGVPVIEVPIIGQVPIPPREQVILAGTTATASVAAALLGKSLVEWMVAKMKPIVQQILIRGKKLLNRDLTHYELQLYFTAELDKKNLKLFKKEQKKSKQDQYKKANNT